MYQFESDQWTPLPSMREPRHALNPCLFSGVIYLCGACSSGASLMEAFNPETDQYLPPIAIPQQCYCCSYVDNDLLVLHIHTHVVKFAFGKDGLTQYSDDITPGCCNWQNSQPVVSKDNGVYFMIRCGQCLRCDMKTGVQSPIA